MKKYEIPIIAIIRLDSDELITTSIIWNDFGILNEDGTNVYDEKFD